MPAISCVAFQLHIAPQISSSGNSPGLSSRRKHSQLNPCKEAWARKVIDKDGDGLTSKWLFLVVFMRLSRRSKTPKQHWIPCQKRSTPLSKAHRTHDTSSLAHQSPLEKNHIIQKHYWKNNLTNLTRHVQFAQLHTIAPVKAPFLAHFLSSLGAPTFGLLAFSGGLFVPVLCDPKHLKISQAIEDNKMHKNEKKKKQIKKNDLFQKLCVSWTLGKIRFQK